MFSRQSTLSNEYSSSKASWVNEELYAYLEKTKSLPQFIDSKIALSSGATLYHTIKDTFGQFVRASQQVLEKEDSPFKKHQTVSAQNSRGTLKFSFINPATKEAIEQTIGP